MQNELSTYQAGAQNSQCWGAGEVCSSYRAVMVQSVLCAVLVLQVKSLLLLCNALHSRLPGRFKHPPSYIQLTKQYSHSAPPAHL